MKLAKGMQTTRKLAERSNGDGKGVERVKVDFGGKISDEAGIELKRECVGGVEVSEGVYDEFGAW